MTPLILELSTRYRSLLINFIQYTAIPAVAQWLSCCATNRKVADSIPDGVIGIFH